MKPVPLLRVFHLVIPFCYVGAGVCLFAGLFPSIDRWKRVSFGLVVIAYGLFRVRKAFTNREGPGSSP